METKQSFRNTVNSVLALLLLVLSFSSCEDTGFSTNSNYRLQFSTDTLSFDTVFTTIGTATSKIMIYNRNNVALKISEIKLGGTNQSYFKINVDGSKNELNTFNNIEIRPHDSLFVFVSLTVDVQLQNTPAFIDDSLLVKTNGVIQQVKLQAYGQNVEILKGVRLTTNTELNADKPYLIMDSLIVSEEVTLTLLEGCRLYFHNNANLYVYGNLKANGSLEKPVLMRGDRLDNIRFTTPYPYNSVAGQWGGVYLLGNNGNHSLQHVSMNSGYVGLFVSNTDRSTLPEVEISNCRIHNFLLYGLVVQNANVKVVNTEISNTSSFSVYLNGGNHSFIHCTIANYFNNSTVQPTSRDKKSAVMIMNLNRIAPMKTIFQNCIISGSAENEFNLATRYEELYNGTFHNCYIKVPKALTLPQFADATIRWSAKKDTLFKSVNYDLEQKQYFNFMPDSVSPARGMADPTVSARYPLDLNGNNRMLNNKPDMGAYQWQPTKR